MKNGYTENQKIDMLHCFGKFHNESGDLVQGTVCQVWEDRVDVVCKGKRLSFYFEASQVIVGVINTPDIDQIVIQSKEEKYNCVSVL